MRPEEVWLLSIIIVLVGLSLFYVVRLLYRRFKPVHYRLAPRNCYTVCSVNGDNGNEDIAKDAPLATIREALKRERLSEINGAYIVLLAGHVESIGEEPLIIDSENIHMTGSSGCTPKIVFDKPKSGIEIKAAYSYFANIVFHGVNNVESKGIIIDDGKLAATFVNCVFDSVGCLYKAW